MAPHRNHVEARSSRAPARQYVAESHDHKADAPSRAESRSAAKHTAGPWLPTKCAARLGCEAEIDGNVIKCYRCRSLWTRRAEQAGFRPTACKARAAIAKAEADHA